MMSSPIPNVMTATVSPSTPGDVALAQAFLSEIGMGEDEFYANSLEQTVALLVKTQAFVSTAKKALRDAKRSEIPHGMLGMQQ